MKNILLHIIFLFVITASYSQVSVIRDPNVIRKIQSSNIGDSAFSSLMPYYTADCIDLFTADSTFVLKSGFSPYSIYQANYLLNIPNIKTFNGIGAIGAGFDFSKSNKFGVNYQFLTWFLELPEPMITNKWDIPVYNNIGLASRVHNNIVINHDFHLIYYPYSFLKMDLAYSKNFLGDGYRSLLLSDFSSSYPYLKIETKFLNLKYSCIWAIHSNIENDEINVINRTSKLSTFHYLDIKLDKRFSIGIFEGILGSGQSFFSFEDLNPIIFLRPVTMSMGSGNNMLLGANFKFIIKSGTLVYGQFVLDDFVARQIIRDIKHTFYSKFNDKYGWVGNKWGVQVGIKTFNALKIKDLDAFAELNVLRPYLYSSSNASLSYSHAGQPLAHPLGANLVEFISGITYKYERFIFDFKFMYANTGVDTVNNTHFGQDIFKITTENPFSEYPYSIKPYYNVISQGVGMDLISSKLDVGYVYNKKKNTIISFGLTSRLSFVHNNNSFMNIVYIGIKSNMRKLETIY